MNYICKRCGKEHDGTFGSGNYCSRNCANARNPSEETKSKISKALTGRKVKYPRKKVDTTNFKKTLERIEREGRVCIECGEIYHSKDLARKKCFTCLPKKIVYGKKSEKTVKSILDVSKRTAIKILRRMNLPCSCCGFYIEGVSLDVHHIHPRSLGGDNSMSNLTYICPNCHRLAHFNVNLLKTPLISIEEYLKRIGKNWLDYYYGK